jgi:hypothetical protein
MDDGMALEATILVARWDLDGSHPDQADQPPRSPLTRETRYHGMRRFDGNPS